MKKIICLIAAFLSVTFSYSQTKEEVYSKLKAEYNLAAVRYDVDRSGNVELKNALSQNSFIVKQVAVNDLALSKVVEVKDSQGTLTISIPFKDNPKNAVTFQIMNNDFRTVLHPVVSKIAVDAKATGSVTIITATESFTNIYSNGNLSGSTAGKKSCFRACFDAAYDTICDDFVGCVAWALSPWVAVTAAVYCESRC